MKSQKELILNRDWNVLIVLDACRYDAFEKSYDDYLSGELSMVKSSGSETREWLRNTFNGRKIDATYYSANPYINSGGHGDVGHIESCFSEVIDLHLDEWDDEKGTVLPETFPRVYKGETPAILHYIQPHQPYLAFDDDCGIQWSGAPGGNEGILFEFKKRIVPVLRKFIGDARLKALAKLIYGERPINQLDKFAREKGMIAIVDAYLYNLKRAFKSVQEIVEMVDGKVIVTADHGELLGDSERWGHPPNENTDILRNVPWMVIE